MIKPLNYLVQSQDVPEPAGYYDETKPLVIYHGNCLDGFTAAYAAWLKYPSAEFVAGVYGEQPPACEGREVYLLDFSYKEPVLASMAASAKRIVILDHHKTAQEDLNDIQSMNNVYVYFDMDKSGARLAWEYFHPGLSIPWLVRYVEDRDLWRFSMSDTKVVNAALFSWEYSFDNWTMLLRTCETAAGRVNLRAEGSAIERKQAKDIKELLAVCTQELIFCCKALPYGEVSVACANLPYTLASDAAHTLAEGRPFGATYYQNKAGKFIFSLRSCEDGIDVSEVAKSYGGGGHKHAAGFMVDRLEDL